MKKYRLDGDDRTFHNIQMLPSAAKKELEAANTLVKRRSMNEIRKAARDAAAKWVLDKKASTKNLVVENIKTTELNPRNKSCQMRGKNRYCFIPNTKRYSLTPCCVDNIDNGKYPCCR